MHGGHGVGAEEEEDQLDLEDEQLTEDEQSKETVDADLEAVSIRNMKLEQFYAINHYETSGMTNIYVAFGIVGGRRR